MESKIGAAELAAAGGVPAWIASPADLPELLAGRDAGTFFAAADRGEPAFKLWLRHGKRMVGAVRIDDGAARAITAGNASLLAVGVTAVVGAFRVGDGVEIVDAADRVDRPRHRRRRLGHARSSARRASRSSTATASSFSRLLPALVEASSHSCNPRLTTRRVRGGRATGDLKPGDTRNARLCTTVALL